MLTSRRCRTRACLPQQIMKSQDTQLGEVGQTIGVLTTMGRAIGDELEDQNRLLDEMESEIESTTQRLKRTIDKVDKVLAISKGLFSCAPVSSLFKITTCARGWDGKRTVL